LLLLAEEQGKLYGVSVYEEFLDADRSQGFKAILHIDKLEGEVISANKAKFVLMPENGQRTVTELELVDGDSLRGISRVVAPTGEQAEAELEYTWEAGRFIEE
jgi:hypothetical protein